MGSYINPKVKVSDPKDVLPKDTDVDVVKWLENQQPKGMTPASIDYTAIQDSYFADLDGDGKKNDQYLILHQSGKAKDPALGDIHRTFAVLIHKPRESDKGPTPQIVYGTEGNAEQLKISDFDGDGIADIVIHLTQHDNDVKDYIPVLPLIGK